MRVPIRLLAAPDKNIKAFECLSSLVVIIAVSHSSTGRDCRLVLYERKDLHPGMAVCERQREILAFDHLALIELVQFLSFV